MPASRRGLGVRTGGVDGPPRRQVAQAPGKQREDHQRDRHHQPLAGGLTGAEPLEAGGQVADELAFPDVAKRLTPDHQGSQGHHDRRQAQPRHQDTIDRPHAAPGHERSQADQGDRQARPGQ